MFDGKEKFYAGIERRKAIEKCCNYGRKTFGQIDTKDQENRKCYD